MFPSSRRLFMENRIHNVSPYFSLYFVRLLLCLLSDAFTSFPLTAVMECYSIHMRSCLQLSLLYALKNHIHIRAITLLQGFECTLFTVLQTSAPGLDT